MKIWKCSAWNGDEDLDMLLVGEDEESTYKRFENIAHEKLGYAYGMCISELNEIDGYKIMIEPLK
jgi:hypothetical protein